MLTALLVLYVAAHFDAKVTTKGTCLYVTAFLGLYIDATNSEAELEIMIAMWTCPPCKSCMRVAAVCSFLVDSMEEMCSPVKIIHR